MIGTIKTYEQWLSQADYALHLMRCARADSLLDFADRDPVGFALMVDAMFAIGATITPEVNDRWNMIKRSAQGAGKVSRATTPDLSTEVSLP